MTLTDLTAEDFRAALKPLGGIHSFMMLDLPSVVPIHKDRLLFHPDEAHEIEEIIEGILKHGYLNVKEAVAILQRPLALYDETTQSINFVVDGAEDVFRVYLKDLNDILKNFRSPTVLGDAWGQKFYKFTEDMVALDILDGQFRVVLPWPLMFNEEVMSKLGIILTACTEPSQVFDTVRAVARELGHPTALLNPTKNKIALLSSDGEWFVPLTLTEVMDFVSFFS